jgi:hypothetical protein
MNDRLTRKLKTIYKIQTEIDELQNEKNKLKKELEELIMEARMENKKFSVGDRTISYIKRTTTEPLTNKYVNEILKNYYKNDIREADNVYKYIINHRKKTTKYQLEILKKRQRMIKEDE